MVSLGYSPCSRQLCCCPQKRDEACAARENPRGHGGFGPRVSNGRVLPPARARGSGTLPVLRSGQRTAGHGSHWVGRGPRSHGFRCRATCPPPCSSMVGGADRATPAGRPRHRGAAGRAARAMRVKGSDCCACIPKSSSRSVPFVDMDFFRGEGVAASPSWPHSTVVQRRPPITCRLKEPIEIVSMCPFKNLVRCWAPLIAL
mmetsp:Transcript_39176/g.108963  ORF Transcript_39176/g.108963 Transcript_39176/m.108963 type:complete len:202 (+) Transcript_39176:746-1351(+)